MPTRKELFDFALALPGSELHHPWGEDVVKVRGKIFVFLGREGTETENHGGFGVKLPASGVQALESGKAAEMGYGMGRKGWVTVKPSAAQAMSSDAALRWIKESYAAVAPKTLAKQVFEQTSSADAPKPKPKKAAVARKAPAAKTATKKKPSAKPAVKKSK